MPIISFIIPAMNASKTISKTINSILNLNLNAEVIVVENGSTDETIEIVEKMIKNTSKKIILIKSEKGVSRARNKGLEMASGEWIFFVDADDFLLKEASSFFRSATINSDVDLWIFGHKSGEKIRKVTNNKSFYIYNDIVSCKEIMLRNPTKYMQVWAKLFKKSIIIDNKLRFNESLSFAEDSDFTLRYVDCCKKIAFSNGIVYHYSLMDSSTMRVYDGRKTKEYINSMIETQKSMSSNDIRVLNSFNHYVLIHMNIVMVREVFSLLNNLSFHKKIEQMKSVRKEQIFCESIKNIKLIECVSLRMLPILFIKLKANGLAGMMYFVRAYMNNRRETGK